MEGEAAEAEVGPATQGAARGEFPMRVALDRDDVEIKHFVPAPPAWARRAVGGIGHWCPNRR